ncbi:MAG TPA: Ppx/GppA phosphatase family protein [Nitrospiria bacterium]|nr:Ppx/GppA phosphatase family protein [Nitrospiria bacterium]
MAGIDIGSNTLRLMIAELRSVQGRVLIQPIFEARRITRLGEGIVKSGRLSPAAMSRTLQALKEFRAALTEHPVARIIAVATSAVREAENRPLFLDRVKEESGFDVEVISGEEEARRTLLGVRHGLGGDDSNLLVLDIGGGSTEWIVVTGGRVQEMKTFDIGVVKLTDRYLVTDPPSAEDQRQLIRDIEDRFRPMVPSVGRLSGHRFVGVAGSVTTLAALELGLTTYDASRVQNMRLGFARVENWYRKLVGMTLEERRRLAGLEKGREDLIVAGTALLWVAMRMAGSKEAAVSDYGLREGILIDGFERNVLR